MYLVPWLMWDSPVKSGSGQGFWGLPSCKGPWWSSDSLTEHGQRSGNHLPEEDAPAGASFPLWVFPNSCSRRWVEQRCSLFRNIQWNDCNAKIKILMPPDLSFQLLRYDHWQTIVLTIYGNVLTRLSIQTHIHTSVYVNINFARSLVLGHLPYLLMWFIFNVKVLVEQMLGTNYLM